MKILLISQELNHASSGNGVLSQNLVRALSKNHDLVTLEAVPNSGNATQSQPCNAGVLSLGVNVPHSAWGSLARDGPWKAFCDGCPSAISNIKGDACFDVVIGVDFHGYLGFQAIRSLLQGKPAYVAAFFRVFHTSSELLQCPADEEFYRRVEESASKYANQAIVLCRHDKENLELLSGVTSTIISPPLRPDIEVLAKRNFAQEKRRKYLTCAVRLSPEKNTMLFVEVVELLSKKNMLSDLGIVPLLCGSSSNQAFSKDVYTRLKSIAPNAVIIKDFISAESLATIFSQTVINFHPALYEPYGMTIVEAGALGATSIIHHCSIGVTELFSSERREVICADLSKSTSAAAAVEQALRDSCRIKAIGNAAQKCALRWTLESYARRFEEAICP